jgi:hypothetical protein
MVKTPKNPQFKIVHRGDAEDAERERYFWRIGERPILQKLHACGYKYARKDQDF